MRGVCHSIGPDAVMVHSDQSLVSSDQSPIKAFPLAKNNLIGVKVITEDGKLLGEIANVYVHLGESSLFIYEVRSSILDRLLGHALYFPASFGCAFADDATRLVVSNNTERQIANLMQSSLAFSNLLRRLRHKSSSGVIATKDETSNALISNRTARLLLIRDPITTTRHAEDVCLYVRPNYGSLASPSGRVCHRP